MRLDWKARAEPAMYSRHTRARPALERRDGLVPVLLEVGHPRAQRLRVVLTQRLHVADLEPADSSTSTIVDSGCSSPSGKT